MVSGIAVDTSNQDLCISGSFHGSIDFDPGAGQQLMQSGGAADLFIVKLDKSGNYQWGKRIGGRSGSYCNPTSLCIGGLGGMYVSGNLINAYNVDFDPGPDSAMLSILQAA